MNKNLENRLAEIDNEVDNLQELSQDIKASRKMVAESIKSRIIKKAINTIFTELRNQTIFISSELEVITNKIRKLKSQQEQIEELTKDKNNKDA